MSGPLDDNQDDQAKTDDAAPASNADSSSAPADSGASESTDDSGKTSFLDVVTEAISASKHEETERDSEGETPPEGSTEDEQQSPGEDAGEPDDISDEEMSSYPKRTQKRIKQLLDGRRQAAEEAERYKTEAEGNALAAQRYNAIEQFRVESDLTTDEMATGFEIMRLIKQDPVKALASLSPYIDRLRQVTGEVLPEDLERRVREGDISENDASELSRSRSRAALQAQAAERADARAQEAERQTENADQARTLRDALNAWDAMQFETDPEYKHLRDFVISDLKASLAASPPKTVAEVNALLNHTKKAVSDRLSQSGFRRETPKPPVDPVRSSETNGSAAVRPEPKSTLDVVKSALESMPSTR